MEALGFVNAIYIVDLLGESDIIDDKLLKINLNGRITEFKNNTATQLFSEVSKTNTFNPTYYVKIHNIPMFEGLMNQIASSVKGKREYPIIHIECHGSKENGILLPAINKYIPWTSIASMATIVNKETHNNLMLVIAGCDTANLLDNLDFSLKSPFGCFVGSTKTTSEGIIKRFKDFYLHLLKYNDFTLATEVIIKDDFKVVFSVDICTTEMTKHLVMHNFGKSKRRFIEYTTSKLKENGMMGNIKEIRTEAKIRINEMSTYYEVASRRYLHGRDPRPFDEVNKMAERFRREFIEEAKTNKVLAKALKLKKIM